MRPKPLIPTLTAMCCFSLNFSEVVVSELEQFSGLCDISGAAGDAFPQRENALSRSDFALR
jgi:hypothetical protein